MRSLRDYVDRRATGRCECTRCLEHHGRCREPLGEAWSVERVDEDGPEILFNVVGVCEACRRRRGQRRRVA